MKLRFSWRKNRFDAEALLHRGFPSFLFQRNPRGLSDGVPVFCYHAAEAEAVESDFAFLAENGYRTLTADQFFQYLEKGSPPGDRVVVLTVDDGAHALYSVTYPALKRYGFHAIAFVAPAFHRDGYELPDHARPCTWAELREMDASGHVDVQAHTWSHRFIPNWPEPLDLAGIDAGYTRAIQSEPADTVKDDLAKTKSTLESRLEKRVVHMAFPMYTGTGQAISDGQAVGYESFWWGTLRNRRANKPGDPKTRIARISAEYIRRLPGKGRMSLSSILLQRFRKGVGLV